MTDTTTYTLLDQAIRLADTLRTAPWNDLEKRMRLRVERLEEQVRARPTLPPELDETYREEIDALTLENMHLGQRLQQTTAALEQARQALRAERARADALTDKVDDIEQRLVALLHGSV